MALQTRDDGDGTPISLLDTEDNNPPLIEHYASAVPGNTIQTTQVAPSGGDGAGDAFWGDDPHVLLQTDRLMEFFPTKDQTLPERMNAVSRLVVYTSIALSVYQGKATATHFGIIIMAMLYIMYKNQTIVKLSKTVAENGTGGLLEKFDDNEVNCIMPTAQNPYMNFLPGDTPGRAPACVGVGVQETAANLLDNQLFSDVDDLFSRNANQRLFRTMPDTTGLPDREKYANWLVKGTEGCKTTGNCAPYEDLRNQRQPIPEDLDADFGPTGFSF